MRYASSGGTRRFWPQRGGLLERRVGHPSDALSGRQHAGGHASAVVHPGDGNRFPQCRSARQVDARQRGPGAFRSRPMDRASERHRQLRPALGRSTDAETIDPATTAYAQFVNDPAFLSTARFPIRLRSSSRASASRGTSSRTNERSSALTRPMLRAHQHAEPGGVGHREQASESRSGSRARHRSGPRCPSDADVAGSRGASALPGPVPTVHGRACHRVRFPQSESQRQTSPSSRLAPDWSLYRLHLVEGC